LGRPTRAESTGHRLGRRVIEGERRELSPGRQHARAGAGTL